MVQMELREFLEICGFREFPFEIKPIRHPEIWAGREKILKELKHFVTNVKVNGLCEFGIITGEKGSGKTHSLFHIRYIIEQDAKEEGIPALVGYIDNPCGLGPKKLFPEVYRYITSAVLGSEELKKIFANSIDLINQLAVKKSSSLPPGEQARIRTPKEWSEWCESIYKEIINKPLIPYKLMKSLTEGESKALDWITGMTKKSERIRGVTVQPLVSNILCAKALANIINLAVLRKTDGTPNLYSAAFLFVDQLEDIGTASPTVHRDQIVGWRTLIDEVQSYFGVLWAMTGSAEDISSYLTPAVDRRQTSNPEKLKLLPLEIDKVREFIIEIMKHFRKVDVKVPSIYPFSKDGLEEVITQTTERLPSHLLTSCRIVTTKAAEEDRISSVKDKIDRDMVLEYLT